MIVQGFVAAALEHFWSSGSGLKDDKQLHAALDNCDQGRDSGAVTCNGPCSPPGTFQQLKNGHQHTHQQLHACVPGMEEVR